MKTKPSQQEFVARARVMKALAHPDRLKIIDELSREERCLCELEPLFETDRSTLSRHISALRNAGIVRERREGVRVYLKLATPCILHIFDCTMKVIQADAKQKHGWMK